MRRRWLGVSLGALCAAALAWAVVGVFESRRYREALDLAGREIEAGRYESARGRLAGLDARWPGCAEVEFALGVCEQALGRPGAALAAWSKLPAGSPFAARAAVPKARILILERGEFAAAEGLLRAAVRGRSADAVEARQTLARLLFWEGRLGEMRRVLRDGWNQAPDRADALRELWKLDTDPIPDKAIRAALDRSARDAPDDDRAWLARAHLATRSGRLDEAAGWLDACLRKRPGDPAVWRARLDWAVTAGDADEGWRALGHLSAGQFSAAETLALRAWFAARRGAAKSERRALEELVDLEPGDTQALERLAVLAIEAGDAGRAARWRREKAEADRVKERYHDLLVHPVRPAEVEELARVAEALGRPFEARGWWTLLVVSKPDNPAFRAGLDRVSRRTEAPPGPPDRSLADLFADLAPPPAAPTARAPQPAAASPLFRDDAGAARLSSFVFVNGASPLHQLPETASGGVGLIDYDGDGWLDVYLVQGGPFPPDAARPSSGDRLFRNNRDGTFDDVSTASGVAGLARGYGHGVAVGDFDNDGRPDLFLTRWRAYQLLRNRGDGTFEDATERAGLAGDRDWPTSAAFADLDGDGDLDLYVAHYLVWNAHAPRACWDEVSGANVACRPRDFEALPDHLFRNDGGRFVDVSKEAGIVDRDGRGLGVVAADLDGDGLVDLYVANDTTANFLFHNLGGLRFEETAHAAGAAANAHGGYQAGMGVACGDLDGDGRPDLAVTNFFGESTSLYRNLGGGMFADRTAALGLAEPSRYLLGFGVAFLDADDDGRLDLMTANGHVSDLTPRFAFAMPAQLLLGGAGGRLTDVSARSGAPFRVPHVGRGLAAGDLDNDGRTDAVVVAQNEPPVYFHNQTEGGRSLTIRLEGVRSNRDAVGARVTVTRGDGRQVAQRTGGGSYQSSGDPRLHFGLGVDDRPASVEVRWPSGRVGRYDGLNAGGGYRLREGDADAKPLTGFEATRAGRSAARRVSRGVDRVR